MASLFFLILKESIKHPEHTFAKYSNYNFAF